MRPTPLLFACCLAMLCGAVPLSRASTGASQAPPAAAPLLAAAPLDAAPRRGALYRVRQRGQTAYLFGTIHVGQQGFFPLEAEVRAALAAASKLVMELDVRESGLFQTALERHARPKIAFARGLERLEQVQDLLLLQQALNPGC